MTDWKRYEETATVILNGVAEHLGLKRVEGKQTISGLRSGTEWEIDAKGVSKKDEAFVIIECRRYKSKLKQEHLGGLAYRMIDTGAASGIIVTPLGLQEGAETITKAENIVNVQLPADATPEEFVLEFLGKIFLRPRAAELKLENGSPTVAIAPASSANSPEIE